MTFDTEAYKKSFLDWADDFDNRMVSKFPIANKAKESGARPAWILIGTVAFLLIFSLWKCGQNVTSNLIGFIVPTYYSILALRTKGTDDDVQWLTYWVFYSFFVCAESLTDAFVNWIPLYYLFKSLLLVWMMHPSTLGAKLLFQKVIDPVVGSAETGFNAFFDENKRAELKEKLSSVDISKLANSIPQQTKRDMLDEAKKNYTTLKA